jgi:hypothetical protein
VPGAKLTDDLSFDFPPRDGFPLAARHRFIERGQIFKVFDPLLKLEHSGGEGFQGGLGAAIEARLLLSLGVDIEAELCRVATPPRTDLLCKNPPPLRRRG